MALLLWAGLGAFLLDCGGGGSGGSSTGPQDDGGMLEASVPLLVHEALPVGATGTDRSGGVATFGLPFAEQVVGHIGGRPALAVEGADVYQFRTLSTWPGGSVRWALVDVQTDLLAGQAKVGLSVIAGTGLSVGADLAHQEGGSILLNTGPLQARVRTQGFRLFDSVFVDGVDVAPADAGPGIVGFSDAGLPLEIAPGTQVTIEENGPARVVVRADGVLRDSSGQQLLDFTCRIIARAGGRELDVVFTLRNADRARPRHVRLEGLELVLRTSVTPGPAVARFSSHAGETSFPLAPGKDAALHLAYTSATTLGVLGPGTAYLPHIPKVSNTQLAQEGYRLVHDGAVLRDFGDPDLYPAHGWADLSDTIKGVTLVAGRSPYQWPQALELYGNGTVVAGVFTDRNAAPYTFAWRQHESRTVRFAFHAGAGDDPPAAARALDLPLTGRAADYRVYDAARVFAYDLLSVAEQNDLYAALGIAHQVSITNEHRIVTRFLAAGTTGGGNNHASIERRLAGEWLRQGHGGQYVNGLDLALYKSEWQILRSDGFHHDDDPGASNEGLPHSKAYPGDDEHRYREGIILAYHLTGDERYREALLDEAEILPSLAVWPHERSMYLSMRAQALLAEFTDDAALRQAVRERVQYNNSQTLDVQTGQDGWGWEAAPGKGNRHYYVFSTQSQSEKPPGENYISRGFVTASLGPLGLYHAARCLGGDGDLDGMVARRRLADLAHWTREELFPFEADPARRWLAYSYAVKLRVVNSWESAPYHPVLLGMAEAYAVTGEEAYLQRGLEQIQAFAAQDHGSQDNDLYKIESRLDVQHFLSAYRDWLGP